MILEDRSREVSGGIYQGLSGGCDRRTFSESDWTWKDALLD